jgi:hypothetical protein
MVLLWELVVRNKKAIQDEDVGDRTTFVSIHRRLCEHRNVTARAVYRERPRSTAPDVDEEILDIENETSGISTRGF